MDARPVLSTLARMLNEVGLEAVLIGNAAAALQAAPVTTIDFDFMFRKTPRNLQKLKALANNIHGVLMRPFYPSSDLFRLTRDEDGLQVDFMATIHGVKSFSSLRARARQVDLEGHVLLVADLADIVQSKRAAGRPQDKAVLSILEKTLNEKARDQKTKARRPEGGK